MLRLEEQDESWLGEEPLWLVAPYVPEWLKATCWPLCIAPGCYCIEPRGRRFLWIAANELPLVDELVPFLMARSGQALEEFGHWVTARRPLEWVLTMLEYLPMALPTREDLLSRFRKTDDPEILARRQHIIEFLLEGSPQTQQQLIKKGIAEGIEKGVVEGRLTEARALLRRVLARRQLTPSQEDDARIESCTDLVTLERWFDRAVTAVSVSDALG